MLKIGSLIDGKYRILSVIGRGGMSVVYMAINERANKTWAVKEVRKDGVVDFEAVKQGLVVETEMLKRLRHPNLPSIIDVIEDKDSFLIVMDYVEGNPLSKTIEEFGAQPQEYVIEWAKQLCDVLGYLHSRTPPIIYRDMKPANIMLKPDGNLTLIDFGTAREFKERNLADTTCLGTIGYAAPEQFGGQGQTDARTDIYCLGACLYHLVTGCNPSEPPYEIKPIREINPSLSSGLEKIIQKCVQRNPDDRYQSCAELMYALEHYEKIDDEYKRTQKRKLNIFISMLVSSLLFFLGGIGINSVAQQMASDTYANILYSASRTPDYDEKIKYYESALDIPNKGGDKAAYLGLINTFKENDNVFTIEEQNLLVTHIKNKVNELEKYQENYAEVCFEIGKLFWYYYEYGGTNDNQITRMISAIEWFDDVINHAPEGFANLNMAKVYRDIGIFYRDISIKTIEANDRGLYKPFFENLQELISLVEDDDESEIVKLELYELARSSLQQYATKFKTDGVDKDSLILMFNTVSENIRKIDTTTDITSEKQEKTISLLDDTINAINIAFGS